MGIYVNIYFQTEFQIFSELIDNCLTWCCPDLVPGGDITSDGRQCNLHIRSFRQSIKVGFYWDQRMLSIKDYFLMGILTPFCRFGDVSIINSSHKILVSRVRISYKGCQQKNLVNVSTRKNSLRWGKGLSLIYSSS